jgi:hypothetical protein
MRRRSGKRAYYPLHTLSVGESFVVPADWDMTHVRLAASQYGKSTGKVFTCRKQNDGSMRVWRCEANQADVDRRGPDAMRLIPMQQVQTIPNYAQMPTEAQFKEWLSSLPQGGAYTLKGQYSIGYQQMAAWTVEHAVRTRQAYSTSINSDGLLVIVRGSNFPLDRPLA